MCPVAFCGRLSRLIATKLMISPTPMIHVGRTARVGWQSQRLKWQRPFRRARAFASSCRRVRGYWVAAIMTATVSSGMSHIGKWPLDSNQCRLAEGNATVARAACRGRHSRSCRPHPITIRPVGSAAGPVCSGPLARSRTKASNVDVVLRLASSVATTFGSSAQGRVDSCASSAVRDTAFLLSIGRPGRIALSSRPETPMVALK